MEDKQSSTPQSAVSSRERVLVGLSGRAQSALACAILKNQGYTVQALHLRFPEGIPARCCVQSSETQVRDLAARLDVELHVEDVTDRFEADVLDYAVHEKLSCHEGNPCIPCHTGLIFGELVHYAERFHCQKIATGHLAHVVYDQQSRIARLYSAPETEADQSFLLFRLDQETLSRTLLPLGGIPQNMLKRLSEQSGLDLPSQSHSTQPCFLGDSRFKTMIENRVDRTLIEPGQIQTADGFSVGSHQGLYRYRIGDSEGFTISSREQAKWVVAGFVPGTNALVVGEENQLITKRLLIGEVHWLFPTDRLHPARVSVRLSNSQKVVSAELIHFINDKAHLVFDEPQKKVALGQNIVFYQEREVLGGGTVQEFLDTQEERNSYVLSHESGSEKKIHHPDFGL